METSRHLKVTIAVCRRFVVKPTFLEDIIAVAKLRPRDCCRKGALARALRLISDKNIFVPDQNFLIYGNKYRCETVASQNGITSRQYCAAFPVVAVRCLSSVTRRP